MQGGEIELSVAEPPQQGGNGRQQAAGTCPAPGKALPRGCRAYLGPRNWVILY